MISVSQRFAGFRSASSLLADTGLSRAQKKAALLSWREALNRQTPATDKENTDRLRILQDIDDALRSLADDKEPQDKPNKTSRRRVNAGG